MRWIAVIAAVLLLGCSHRHAADQHVGGDQLLTAPAGEDIWVGLVTHSERGPEQNALGKPLHTGDRVAIIVQAPSPRFVYLLNIPPDGSPVLLSPREAADPIEGAVRLPAAGWYELAEPQGLELLGLLVSREPIALDAQGLAHILSRVRQTARRADLVKYQAAAPPGFSAAGHASMGIRAASLALEGGSLRIAADDDEVIVLMDIDHRPRLR